MRDRYMRTTQSFIMVYSISDRKSFDEIQYFWEQILRVKDVDWCPSILVGNKCDLDESKRVISFEEGEKLAKRLNIPFIETRFGFYFWI